MFFRPTFCANCGEKIERTDWGILTSRRFCPVCESEFKGVDLIPRVVVTAGVIGIVFGFGSYLRSGTSYSPVVARSATVPGRQDVEPHTLDRPSRIEQVQASTPRPTASNTAAIPPRSMQAASGQRDTVPDADASEQMYYCGARTKKGTPCSRRVKGYVRCFQHTGMQAMLPEEQLKVR